MYNSAVFRAPIDTSTLGPIKVDTSVTAFRAQVVRDALLLISRELEKEGHVYRATAFNCAAAAQDDVLAKLGRLLK